MIYFGLTIVIEQTKIIKITKLRWWAHYLVLRVISTQYLVTQITHHQPPSVYILSKKADRVIFNLQFNPVNIDQTSSKSTILVWASPSIYLVSFEAQEKKADFASSFTTFGVHYTISHDKMGQKRVWERPLQLWLNWTGLPWPTSTPIFWFSSTI